MNANGESNFLKHQESVSDDGRVNAFLTRVAAMPDQERRAELAKYGIGEDEFQTAMGGLNADRANQAGTKSPKQLERERQEVEGKAPEATPTQGPIEGAIAAMTGAPLAEELGISIPAAVGGTEAANEFGNVVQRKLDEMLPNHPGVAKVLGPVLSIAMLGGGGSALQTSAESEAGAGASGAAADLAHGASFTADDEITRAAEEAQRRVFTPEYNQAYQEALDGARRGVVTKAEQQAAAAAAPMTPAEVSQLRPGTILPAERATALVNFERDEAVKIQELARQALDEGDLNARAEALQRIDNLVSVHDPKVQGVTAETGRALGSLTAPTPTAFVKAIREQALSRIGTPGYMTEDEVLRSFLEAKTPEEAARLAEAAGAGGAQGYVKNFLMNMYISSILSPNSIAKKAVSDALNIAYQIPARGLGEMAGYAERAAGAPAAETITPGETAAMIRAAVRSFGDAMSIGWQSAYQDRPLFQEGVGWGESIPERAITSEGTRFEGTPWGKGLDLYGNLISVPGRGIVGVDQAAKLMHYRMELAALAEHTGYVTALAEGREGAAMAARAQDVTRAFLEKPPEWAIDAARTRAKVETFQQDLNGSLGAIDQLRQGSYLARTIIPFFRTGSNIVRMGLERTVPLSTQAYREAWAAGGRERDLMVAKNALGDLLTVWLAHLWLTRRLTGYGPRNPQVRDLWLRDHQPYSLKVGDRWVPFAPTEPMAWIAGNVADAAEMMAYLPNQTAWSVADAIGASAVREFSRQGFWSDLARVVHTIDAMSQQGVDARGISAGLGNLVGTVVSPQFLADVAHGIDPARRQTTTFLDGIRNRVPYLTETGVPTRDPWGEPVVVPPGFLMNEFPAFKAHSEGKDPESDELVRLYKAIGYTPPTIPRAIGGRAPSESELAITNFRDGVRLSPEIEDEWARLRGEIENPRTGQNLKQAVGALMRDPRYREASDQRRAMALNRVFVAYREQAMRALLREHPELVVQVNQLRERRREMAATPGPAPATEADAGGIQAP